MSIMLWVKVMCTINVRKYQLGIFGLRGCLKIESFCLSFFLNFKIAFLTLQKQMMGPWLMGTILHT